MGAVITQNAVENSPSQSQSDRGSLGEIVRPSRESRIARLEAMAVRERWGANDERLKALAESLLDRVLGEGQSKAPSSNRDAATITAALTSFLNYGLAETKFELEKIKAEDWLKPNTTVNVGVGVNLAQYEERVAGRPYAEVRAELYAEAKEMVRQLEAQDADAARQP